MRRAERKHERLICCGEVSLTAPQKRNHPAGGFFFCVHFTPQSRLRLDGRSVSGLLLFTSTPQSIAKPSPGWNKVALLTAVRNSPCFCPFSVSLHPPLAALNSEPRPGSLLVRFTSSRIKQTRGRTASPHFYNLLCLSAVSGFRRAHKRAYGFAVLAAAAGIMVPSPLTYTLSTFAPERVIR